MIFIKKILLIITPTTEFREKSVSLKQRNTEYIPQPLGLCYLASILREKGYDVEIFDPHIEIFDIITPSEKIGTLKSMIIKKIKSSHYDIIGISAVYIYTYEWAHFIAKVTKDHNKNIPIVIGGGYPSLLLEDVLKDENIDFLIIGEAEVSFPKLLEYFSSNNKSDLESIDGIIYREKGKIIIKPKKTFIKDIDTIPFPAWDLVNVEKYIKFSGKRSLIMISSRGCPYACTFCNSYKSWGRGFRQRSSENILAEIDYLITNFNINDIVFVDDNMTVNKKRFMEIANGIKNRNISWETINISSFTTDEEMLKIMKVSGCHKTAIAVESAVPKTLKALRKPVDLNKTKELIKFCRKIGLKCRVFYITGLPYDNKEDMIQTFKFSEEFRGDWNQYSMLCPYPGTDIYEYCKKKGYFLEDDLDLSELTIRSAGFIETEDWSRDWAANMTYDYNIKTNFLKNYNLIEVDGNLENAIEDFEYVVKFHPEHLIALICLAYAYHKFGKEENAERLLKESILLLEKPEVQRIYGKYLDWNMEVINFYNNWRNSL